MASHLIGRYIVTDPGICHGKPTFRGTRVLVSDVLEQIASGMAWETVIQEWHESVTKDAIAEALQLATRALLEHVDDFIRRRREGLLRSLRSPHPEAAELAEAGLADWEASLPSNDEGLVDLKAGKPVRWIEGQGWVEEAV